jgi:20S proteasome alpha/beta subunit
MSLVIVYLLLCLLVSCCGILSSSYEALTGIEVKPFQYFGEAEESRQTSSEETPFIQSLREASSLTRLKTGTTIVGICFRDGVVLGADTRSTGGPIVMDKNKLKIRQIARRIYCCGAGTSADCEQVTRKAFHDLALEKIENEISGSLISEYDYCDSVKGAVSFLKQAIQVGPRQRNSNRKVQTVLILGGLDAYVSQQIHHRARMEIPNKPSKFVPSLYQIDMDGVPQRVGMAALGSGSTDAMAVLEQEKRMWGSRRAAMSPGQAGATTEGGVDHNVNSPVVSDSQYYISDLTLEEAVGIVRKAVRAGILNDLGSGSHVDLCVLEAGSGAVRRWREELVTSWDSERLPPPPPLPLRELVAAEAGTHSRGSMGGDGEGEMHLSDAQSSSGGGSLGRVVFSKVRPIRRIVDGRVQEVSGSGMMDHSLADNIELL